MEHHPKLAVLRDLAWAKVNLFLHVVGRRADGYHLLDSLAVFPAIGDVLHGAADAGLSLSVGGPFGARLANEADNLVLRAARRLAAATGYTGGARLVLEKHLPVASGIGGGSADAAATLRLLARLWGVAVPAGLALELGADVPVCLASQPARMGGIGEVLGAAPGLPDFGLVLANPGVAVATPDVFKARAAAGAGFSPTAALPAGWPNAAAMAGDLAALHNDLQDAAVVLCPPIAAVLDALAALPGALLTRMSGSGATCFALFADGDAARHAAATMVQPGWWVWGGEGSARDACGD